MALKNSKTVALERRYDLSTLFCMIGRHGPAVAMALVAMLSVLAAVIIYRTVRGQWRKATAAASKDGPGPEKDAALGPPGQLPDREESPNPLGSTEESDGESPAPQGEVEEDAHLIQGQNLETNVECCAAAAALKAVEEEPLLIPPPEPCCRLRGLTSQTDDLEDHHTPVEETDAASRWHRFESNAVSESMMQKINTGKADEFRRSALETSQGETAKDETNQDETSQRETSQGETSQDETSQDETLQVEMIQEETAKDEPLQDETKDETSQDETVKDETLQVEMVQDETSQDETVKDETLQDETAQDETAQDEPLHDETSQDETASDEPLHDETAQDEPLQDETAQDEPLHDETSQDETARDEGVTGAEGRGCDHESGRREEEESRDYKGGQEEDLEMACKTEDQEAAAAAAACQDEDVPADRWASYEETKQDKGGVLSAMNKEDRYNANEEDNEEVDWHREYMDNGKDHQDAHLSSEKNEDVEKCVGCPVIPRHAEIWTPLPEQLMSLPLTELPLFYEQQLNEEQNECTGVAENVAAPAQDGAEVGRGGGEVAGRVAEEDPRSETVQVGDPHSQNDEDRVLPGVADQLKERSVTRDDNNYAATHEIDENSDQSSLVLLPSVNQPHASEPENRNDDCNGKDCVPVIVIHEDWDIPSATQSSYQQPLSEQKEDNDVTIPVMDAENALPEHGPCLPSLSQEELSGKTDDNEGVDGDNVTALVQSEELPTLLPSLDQEDQGQQQVDNEDSNVSSPTIDEDSGISSKMFSLHLESPPQSQDVDEDVSAPITDEDWDLALDPHLPSLYQQQQCGQDITDRSVGVGNKDNGHQSMVFCSLPSSCHQARGYRSDGVTEPVGASDDMFGQAVEDSYYREFDEFSEQIAAGATNYTEESNKQMETKEAAKPREVRRKEGGITGEKGRTQAKEGGEEEEEEDHEKTEINIMEATMDNNEWMTDGNCQVLPWMSFSLKSYAQNLPKTDQLPTEAPQHCSASAMGDSSNEAKDAAAFSLLDEDADSDKKVTAVHPMPQNVNVTFRVHYVTHSPGQTVAVTGNQQELGNWKDFIPLERAKDGFWANVISLPAESQVEWKFVLVDEGEIRRWEECENRRLDTGHGDNVHMSNLWGFL